jgi:hypothetical protein
MHSDQLLLMPFLKLLCAALRDTLAESDETAKARPIMVEEMKGLGWTEHNLARQRKSDPRKVALARRLCA